MWVNYVSNQDNMQNPYFTMSGKDKGHSEVRVLKWYLFPVHIHKTDDSLYKYRILKEEVQTNEP